MPGLPAPLAPRLHLLPPPVPSSSGCLQLQGPGDCLALCGGGAPVLFPGPGCPLPSQTRSRPPSPAAGCSRKREAKAGPRSLPGLPLPAPPPPCRFGVGGGPGPLTREGGQPGGDKARLGSQPLGNCRTLDVGECLRAPGGSAGPGVQGLGCETWGWPEAWVWPPLGQTLRALQGRGSPGPRLVPAAQPGASAASSVTWGEAVALARGPFPSGAHAGPCGDAACPSGLSGAVTCAWPAAVVPPASGGQEGDWDRWPHGPFLAGCTVGRWHGVTVQSGDQPGPSVPA